MTAGPAAPQQLSAGRHDAERERRDARDAAAVVAVIAALAAAAPAPTGSPAPRGVWGDPAHRLGVRAVGPLGWWASGGPQ